MANVEAQVLRTFGVFLAELERGEFHQDLTQGFVDLIEALQKQKEKYGGKPAGTINISLALKFDGETVDVSGKFKIEKPKGNRERTVFWATPENLLTRTNIHQRDLFVQPITDDRKIADIEE